MHFDNARSWFVALALLAFPFYALMAWIALLLSSFCRIVTLLYAGRRAFRSDSPKLVISPAIEMYGR